MFISEHVDEYDGRVRDFKRSMLAKLLEKCTDSDKKIFLGRYGAVLEIEEKRLRQAYVQLKRMIDKSLKQEEKVD